MYKLLLYFYYVIIEGVWIVSMGNKVKLKPIEVLLEKTIWSFSKPETEPFTKSLHFNANHSVGGYKTKLEKSWKLKQDNLYFLDEKGVETAKFDVADVDETTSIIKGESLAYPGLPFTLEKSVLTDLYESIINNRYEYSKNDFAKYEEGDEWTFTKDFRFYPDFTVSEFPGSTERFWELTDKKITLYDAEYNLISTLDISEGINHIGGRADSYPKLVFHFDLIDIDTVHDTDLTKQKIVIGADETAYRIQNIVFPKGKNQKGSKRDLYYKADMVMTDYTSTIIDGLTDFNTYLNSISTSKWLNYTQAKSLFLQLKVSGEFKLTMIRATLRPENKYIRELGWDKAFKEVIESNVDDVFKRNSINYLSTDTEVIHYYDTFSFELNEPTTISIPIPKSNFDNEMVGFQINGEAELSDAAWYAVVDKTSIRKVNLALNTTTFKKEKYILRNLEHINNEIISNISDEEGLNRLGAGHLFVNVVDNGRTLDAETINKENQYIRVHGNPNVGGAGGFTRGMIETIDLAKRNEYHATHSLFMDDDIEVLPESFKRVYSILSIIKPEYQDYFIEGAMLDEIDGITQYEDTGFVSRSKNVAYMPTKDRYNLTVEKDVLRNNLVYPVENQYAAWWFAVVPMKFVNENSMSLPIFYRGDDIEFSIRNNAKIITMNGLAVWHQPFYTKKSKALENYLVARNSFIDQSVNDFVKDVDYLEKYVELYKKEQRMFNYAAADQVLDALDDYLKGPDYIASLNGIETLQKEGKKNEVFSEDIPEELAGRLHTADEYRTLNPSDMALFYDSDNGHGLPEFVLNKFDDDLKSVEIINQEMLENPGKQFLKKRIAVYDTYNKTYGMRERNQEKYEINEKRFAELMKKFESEGEKVAKQYRKAANRFHSRKFWEDYLGM